MWTTKLGSKPISDQQPGQAQQIIVIELFRLSYTRALGARRWPPSAAARRQSA